MYTVKIKRLFKDILVEFTNITVYLYPFTFTMLMRIKK